MAGVSLQTVLQNAATANGNGVQGQVVGFDQAQQVEVVESGGGTCTVKFQGSFDGTNWYAVGYQLIDNTAVLTRTVADLSVLASSKHVYQLLDPYPQVQANVSAAAGGVVVTIRLYAL